MFRNLPFCESAFIQRKTLEIDSQFIGIESLLIWRDKSTRGAVVDAVAVEPVSTIEFPANRENNREIRQVPLVGAIVAADTRGNS
jgi:hypothetical protein